VRSTSTPSAGCSAIRTCGTLAVVTGAYLAAVFLCGDAVRVGDSDLEERFRRRALVSGVVAGGVAIGGLAVLHSDAHDLYEGLVAGDGLPALVLSALAGGTTLTLVWLRRYEAARFSAALAVAAVVAGWALAQSPQLLPGLTVRDAAASHDTLVAVVVAVLGGAAILFPSLALLFRLTLLGRFDHTPGAGVPVVHSPAPLRMARISLRMRVAAALALVGVGLTNVATGDAWHVVGAACLIAFVAVAYRAALPADIGTVSGSER
jgi:cytochrome bd ubiquinol oxidase subunit II